MYSPVLSIKFASSSPAPPYATVPNLEIRRPERAHVNANDEFMLQDLESQNPPAYSRDEDLPPYSQDRVVRNRGPLGLDDWKRKLVYCGVALAALGFAGALIGINVKDQGQY